MTNPSENVSRFLEDYQEEFHGNDQALYVAFASEDGEMVDQHFGSALGFYIWSVKENAATPLTNKMFGHEKRDGNEDKLKPKLQWLVGCDIVYVASIGGSATKQLVQLGITPIKVSGGPDIEELISDLQKDWTEASNPSLNRIIASKWKQKENNFDEMEEEGWED